MRRRELMLLLGGAMTVAHPLGAQQKAMPVIGFLISFSPPPNPGDLGRGPVPQALKETGYVEAQNMAIERRWAENHYDRLPALAAELVSRKVDLIVAINGTPPALAAKSATSTIPIVFNVGVDPVEFGLVASLAAGRQPHGLQQHLRRADGQAVRAAFRAGSSSRRDRSAG